MKVMAIGASVTQTPSQIRDIARVLSKGVKDVGAVAVVTAVPLFGRRLSDAAHLAVSGDDKYLSIMKELEDALFSVIKANVKIGRQSSVLAGAKLQFNRLSDILDGVFMIGELSGRTMDVLMGCVESLSAFAFLETIKEFRPDAVLLDTKEVIVTDGRFGSAKVLLGESRERIRKLLLGSRGFHVATGGMGSSVKGDITMLGRGGGEYVASVLAASLDADEIEIWSDTDGIMTADPQKVPSARTINRMTYIEAMEMTHFGEEFIYPPAMIPAMKQNIKIRVRNAFNPSFPGTVIMDKSDSDSPFTGISSRGDVALLQITGSGMIGVAGVSRRLFGALAKAGLSVLLISQASSEHSICVGISSSDADKAAEAVSKEFSSELKEMLIDEVGAEKGLSIIAVVGGNMVKTPGIAARVFSALGRDKINVRAIVQGSSELNISIVVEEKDQIAALRALHTELIEKEHG